MMFAFLGQTGGGYFFTVVSVFEFVEYDCPDEFTLIFWSWVAKVVAFRSELD